MRRIVCALLLLAAGCDRGAEQDNGAAGDYRTLGNFDTSTVSIINGSDTLTVNVEVAATPDQHQLGLMERTSLGENEGMIFVYDTPQDTLGGFWMYRTRIPLDIAFIDTAGAIVTIHTMQPCESPNGALCPSYRPSAPYLHALEVNAGYFERHGITVGDTVEVH